jgi:hypothetical protein
MSSSLQRFKWTRENLANCRCPLCGDSDKSKIKARGYFYKKGNDFFYRCHNCGIGHNIYNMLDRVVPNLCKQYALERYTVGEDGNSNYKKLTKEELYPFSTKIEFSTIKYYTPIDELHTNHRCVSYLNRRNIPKNRWCDFGYTSHFGEFAKQFNDEYDFGEEERLIIFIRDETGNIIGAQGRAFIDNKNIPKYITIRKKDDPYLLFGVDRLDKSLPISVVEGPIDSLFIPNAIACLGLGKFNDVADKYPDAIFIVDNEPRNKEVVKTIEDLIDKNVKVCIFPHNYQGKDINDMCRMNGKANVLKVISENIFSGVKAKLILNHWKKI